MTYGTTVIVERPFDEAVAAVRVALTDQGFGVLTEIDVQATMKAKLDADLPRYLILGVCNPPAGLPGAAGRGLRWAAPALNVVVRQTDQGTVVEAIDPMTMVSVSGNPALQPVVDEVAVRLRAALAALAPTAAPTI